MAGRDDVRRIDPFTAPPNATVHVPGSKSLTNRALVCAALAEGTTTLHGVLQSDDTDAMVECVQRLGVAVAGTPGTDLRISGTGGRLVEGPVDLDARLSGTTSRFLLPVLALGRGPYRLDGLDPLRRRPMGEVIEDLRTLGVDITEEGDAGHLPVVVRGGTGVTRHDLPVGADVSSQFVSALLLAAPALGGLTLHLEGQIVSRPFLAMTARVMAAFGVDVEEPDERTFVVPSAPYRPSTYAIEPDASAASYFFALAALTGGRVRIEGIGTSSLQGDARFVDVLEQMGARVAKEAAAIEVQGSGRLTGVDVDLSDIPDMATTVAAVAVFADGPTTVRNVALIRGHETDRIAAIATELRRAGIVVDEHDDGWTIHPGTPQPTTFATYDDHRMAMSLSLLGALVPGIAIADPACVGKTFPRYFEVLDSLRTPDR